MIFNTIPYLSLILMLLGFAYVLFVGEPQKGVQRHPALPYIGWCVFGICLSLVISAYLLSAAESKKLQDEVIAALWQAEEASWKLLQHDIADKFPPLILKRQPPYSPPPP